jgi:tRNA(Ile)-lysidine synthase
MPARCGSARRVVKRQRIAVAVSAGRDSTALWHATARMAVATGGLEVIALHVHHGLQRQADAWVGHLQRQARRWAAGGLPVSLQWRRLQGAPAAGESTEAWARRERYAALSEMAHGLGVGVVLLAHHRRDQAETFVLQALRGAGPAGLSAMPREARRFGITWARPWLEQPREAIEAYLHRHRLGFVEDLSNADTRWARNRLRLQVWPQLAAAFEQAEASLCASAARAQEAAACLKELAGLDMQNVCTPAGLLSKSGWLALSAARRANLLRAWLAAVRPQGVPQTLVQRLLDELPGAVSARWPLGAGCLQLHAGHLRFAEVDMTQGTASRPRLRIDLSHAGRVAVPEWHGAFEVRTVHAAGLAPQRLRHCELRPRSGAERFQRAAASLPRSLKKQFQCAGVAAWARDGPLLFARGELLYVPGLGIDARQQAAPGAPMLGLRWVADACHAD